MIASKRLGNSVCLLLAALTIGCGKDDSKSPKSTVQHPYQVHLAKGRPAILSVSADGKWLVCCSANSEIEILSLSDTQDRYRLQDTDQKLDYLSASFTPDGRYLLSKGTNKEYRDYLVMWNVQTRTIHGTLPIKEGISCFSISSDGLVAAVGDGRGTIELFSLPSLQWRGLFKAHQGLISGMVFLPGSRKLATTGLHDHMAHLWDTETMTTIASKNLQSEGLYVGSVAIDSASAHLAIERGEALGARSHNDTGILVLNANTLDQMNFIKTGSNGNLAISPDGRKIGWGSYSRSLKQGKDIFFAHSKKTPLQATMDGPPPGIVSCAFFDNGRKYVCGDKAGNILFYQVPE